MLLIAALALLEQLFSSGCFARPWVASKPC